MLGHTLSDTAGSQLAFMKIANGTNLACQVRTAVDTVCSKMCELIDLWTKLEDMGWEVRLQASFGYRGKGTVARTGQPRSTENLTQLVEGVRFATGNASLACVAAKMNPVAKGEYEFKNIYHAGVDAVAAADEHVAAVSCKTIPLKEDQVHLTSEGMLALGAAIGDAFMAESLRQALRHHAARM